MKLVLPLDIVYEIRHTFFRAPILLVILVGVVVALASITQVAANPPSFAKMYSGSVYYSSGAYHFEFYAFDQYGSPLTGITYSVNVATFSNGNVLSSSSGRTGTNGQLELTAVLPKGTYDATISAGPQSGLPYWTQGQSLLSIALGNFSTGEVVPDIAPLTAEIDKTNGFSEQPALQVFFPAPDLANTRGLQVYYALVNLITQGGPGPLPKSSMTFLGDLTSSLQEFPLSIQSTSQNDALNVQVEIFSPSGSVLALDTNTSATMFKPYQTPTSVSDDAFSYYASDMTLAVPLMAIVSTYSVYSKDRITGVLESTLVLPITKTGLVVARFVAIISALLLSLAVGMALSDVFIRYTVGYYVFPSTLIAAYAGLMLASFFFVNLTILLAHVTRSTAAVLGLTIGLFMVLGFFWNALVSSLASLQAINSGTPGGARFLTAASFFNPLDYPYIILSLITGTTPEYATSYGGAPASYGINVWSVCLSVIVWIVVSFALVFWSVQRRD